MAQTQHRPVLLVVLVVVVPTLLRAVAGVRQVKVSLAVLAGRGVLVLVPAVVAVVLEKLVTLTARRALAEVLAATA